MTGMPAALAAAICGCSERGSGAVSRLIRSGCCEIAVCIPCTHAAGLPSLGKNVIFTPAAFAAACSPASTAWVNGVSAMGMAKIFLPFSLLGSIAGPGACQTGMAVNLARLSVTADGTPPPLVEPLGVADPPHATAATRVSPAIHDNGVDANRFICRPPLVKPPSPWAWMPVRLDAGATLGLESPTVQYIVHWKLRRCRYRFARRY